MITKKFYPRFEWSNCTGFVDFLYGLAVPLGPLGRNNLAMDPLLKLSPVKRVSLAFPRLFMVVEVYISLPYQHLWLLLLWFVFSVGPAFSTTPTEISFVSGVSVKEHFARYPHSLDEFSLKWCCSQKVFIWGRFQPLHCSRTGLLKQILCRVFPKPPHFQHVSCRFPVSNCLYMGRAWNLQDFWSPMPSVEMVYGPLICRSPRSGFNLCHDIEGKGYTLKN